MLEKNNIKLDSSLEDENVFTKEVRKLQFHEILSESLLNFLTSFGKFIISIFVTLGLTFASIFTGIYKASIKSYLFLSKFLKLKIHQFKFNDLAGRLSFFAFGASSFKNKQYVNGIFYCLFEVGYIAFLALFGGKSLAGLGTLGTKLPTEVWDDMFCHVEMGDNSVLVLVFGLLSLFSIFVFLYIWNRSIVSGYSNYRIVHFLDFKEYIEYVMPYSSRVDELINKDKNYLKSYKELHELTLSISDEALESLNLRLNELKAEQSSCLDLNDIDLKIKQAEEKINVALKDNTSTKDSGLDKKEYIISLKEHLKYLKEQKNTILKSLDANVVHVEEQIKYTRYAIKETIIRSKLHYLELAKLEEKRTNLLNNVEKLRLDKDNSLEIENLISQAKEETNEIEKMKKEGFDINSPELLYFVAIRDKIESKILKLETKYTNKINKLNLKANGISKQIKELINTHTTLAQIESRLNYTSYSKFNCYYKKMNKFNLMDNFYSNYFKLKEIYENSLGLTDNANESYAKEKVVLKEEYEAKLEAINSNFKQIVDNKAQLILLKDKYLKDYKEVRKDLKNHKDDEAYFLELENKLALVKRTDGQINALPSDKLIKSMHKEELSNAKNSFNRDDKYIKTTYKQEEYASKEVIDYMLLNLKYDYDTAKSLVKLITKYDEDTINTLKNDNLNLKIQYEETYKNKYEGTPKSFTLQFRSLFNENFHFTMLAIPLIGIVFLTIMPLFFSILVAFTNYQAGHVPPMQLFTWVGLQNFMNLFAPPADSVLAKLPEAMLSTFSWTIIWAIIATFSNYILGIIFALMINKEGIYLKKLWRTIFVLTIAIPQFVSLLSIGVLLKNNGAFGVWWADTFNNALNFGETADINGLVSKVIIILVNIWVGIPYTILMTSGILMNIPKDLYESSRIDGAGPFAQFTKITMPYIIFVTGPYLITQFIGNINNFNVIFFLTGGGPSIAGSALGVGHTDLLITFLYKIVTSANNPQFGIASAIGIIIFIACAFISIMMYSKSGAVQKEDQFQ